MGGFNPRNLPLAMPLIVAYESLECFRLYSALDIIISFQSNLYTSELSD